MAAVPSRPTTWRCTTLRTRSGRRSCPATAHPTTSKCVRPHLSDRALVCVSIFVRRHPSSDRVLAPKSLSSSVSLSHADDLCVSLSVSSTRDGDSLRWPGTCTKITAITFVGASGGQMAAAPLKPPLPIGCRGWLGGVFLGCSSQSYVGGRGVCRLLERGSVTLNWKCQPDRGEAFALGSPRFSLRSRPCPRTRP